ncbi:MAG: hypothetical protein HC800_18185 [Phormidesmis sp. RL_2_1]|nr:hypothetical protein [Phormidesmis sp. RL_2_1]
MGEGIAIALGLTWDGHGHEVSLFYSSAISQPLLSPERSLAPALIEI